VGQWILAGMHPRRGTDEGLKARFRLYESVSGVTSMPSLGLSRRSAQGEPYNAGKTVVIVPGQAFIVEFVPGV
jgi:hypothetical protein